MARMVSNGVFTRSIEHARRATVNAWSYLEYSLVVT
jgi:hypothetical protein